MTEDNPTKKEQIEKYFSQVTLPDSGVNDRFFLEMGLRSSKFRVFHLARSF
jgi:hypothetical protein